MRVDTWLQSNVALLQKAGIDTARLDCLVLLEDASHKDRAWLLAHGEYELESSIIAALNVHIVQRSEHIPLAYIRGHVEFYGRTFTVNEHVLVPRPDSEAIIDLLNEVVTTKRTDSTIVDVGTGSAALAITAKLEHPQATVIAIDIDPECLAVARHNARKLGADIIVTTGDLLASREGHPLPAFDIVLANLPYVPDEYPVNAAATHEPALALFGGKDGLDLYRRFFAILRDMSPDTSSNSSIITESLDFQHAELVAIANACGYDLQKTVGLAQCFDRRL